MDQCTQAHVRPARATSRLGGESFPFVLGAPFLGTNPVQGRIDPQTKSVTGPVADLVKELARRLGVPYTIIPAADAREVIDLLSAHTSDIGFLAYDAPRAAEVDFSRPYALMQNC